MCPRCLTRPPWRRRSCRPPTRSPRPCGGWRLSDDSAPSPDPSPPVGRVPEGRLMAITRVVMPQLGESVHEGTISKWLVKPGDKVVEFEPMLEVDTDKVNAEVPAPVSGILREILAKEGDTVQAGAEIAVVEIGGDGKVDQQLLPTRGEVPAKPAEGQAPPTTEEAPVPSPPWGEGEREGLKQEPHRYSPGVQMAASDLKV